MKRKQNLERRIKLCEPKDSFKINSKVFCIARCQDLKRRTIEELKKIQDDITDSIDLVETLYVSLI